MALAAGCFAASADWAAAGAPCFTQQATKALVSAYLQQCNLRIFGFEIFLHQHEVKISGTYDMAEDSNLLFCGGPNDTALKLMTAPDNLADAEKSFQQLGADGVVGLSRDSDAKARSKFQIGAKEAQIELSHQVSEADLAVLVSWYKVKTVSEVAGQQARACEQ